MIIERGLVLMSVILAGGLVPSGFSVLAVTRNLVGPLSVKRNAVGSLR
jgi:hypothetical protein